MILHSILNWFAGSDRPALRHPAPRRLALEALEGREVPAGLNAVLDNAGVLTITGTSNADTIRVDQVDNKISVAGAAISLPSQPGTRTVSGGLVIETGSISAALKVPATSVKKIIVNAGGGNDTIDLNSNTYSNSQLLRVPAVVNGGAGNDTIYGTAADDVLDGGADSDVIYGYGGNDTIHAQVGLDRVVGGRGNDTINADLVFDSLLSARSGRLFYDNSFAPGDGTDTLNARLDLSSFSNRLLSPAIREISKATSVFGPVVKLLNTKVPALSQYDSSLTYGSVLRKFKPELGRFLDAVDAVEGLRNSAGLSGTITLGQFKVSSPTAFSTVYANPLGQINSSVLSAARKAGMSFALLDDPASAVRLMMGKNVQLVSLRLVLPRIEAGLNRTYSVPTAIPGVNATVDFGGKVWASAGATFGVDTSGIWVGNAIKGLFVSNAAATVGATLYVKGGVALGIPNLISIASVKGYGEVNGSITFALAGGTKAYFDNLPDYYEDSLKASGKIGYDIGIEIAYKELRGTDHHRKIGTPWTGYTDVVYTTYDWVSMTKRKSFGSGTFRV